MEFDDLTDWLEDAEEIKEAAVDIKHHHKAVEVTTRNGRCVVCPHCGEHLAKSAIYVYKKGWMFCRPCFRKGKGAIHIGECKEAASEEYVFEFEKRAAGNTRFLFTPPPRWSNSRNHTEARVRQYATGYRGVAEPMEFGLDEMKMPAALMTPLIGTGIGYMTSDDRKDPEAKNKGALKGLISGMGVVGGTALGSHVNNGDVGSGLMGGAAGGIISYLLAKGLIG